MKKLLILFILLTIFLSGCGCGLYNLNSFILPDDIEFLALVQELDTPEKICQYMSDNFTYKANTASNKDPYILWKIKKGDCNDFATFAQFIAHYHEYKTYQIVIYFSNCKFKHSIAIYKENKYSFSDNWLYFSAKYNTFLEIIEYDFYLRDKTWTKYIVYDYWNNIIEQGTK